MASLEVFSSVLPLGDEITTFNTWVPWAVTVRAFNVIFVSAKEASEPVQLVVEVAVPLSMLALIVTAVNVCAPLFRKVMTGEKVELQIRCNGVLMLLAAASRL